MFSKISARIRKMTTRTPGHRVLAYQVAKASPPNPNAGTVIGVRVVGGAGKGFASTLGRGGRVICFNGFREPKTWIWSQNHGFGEQLFDAKPSIFWFAARL